jgi:hypothetical protein
MAHADDGDAVASRRLNRHGVLILGTAKVAGKKVTAFAGPAPAVSNMFGEHRLYFLG